MSINDGFMTLEELKKGVHERLELMGCTDISIKEASEVKVTAIFNCKDLTSFINHLQGWSHSGIHLDPTAQRQYAIDFERTTKSATS